MPTVHSVVSEASDHIYLPMITQVAHHIVNSLNLPKSIQDNIHIDTGWTTTKGTRDHHSFRVRGNMFRVLATMQPSQSPVFDYQTFNHAAGHTFYPGQLDMAYIPVLRDTGAEITLHEVPMPCSFSLECSFWISDRNLAYDINKRLNLRFSTGIAHYLSTVYDYPVPKDIISALFALFKHRKFDVNDPVFKQMVANKDSITFAKWLDKLSLADFVLASSRTGKRKELVINKTIDNTLMTIDFEGNKPDEDRVHSTPNGYHTTFTCKFQFAEITALILQYPVIVDNTLLPSTMIPQPRNNDTPIRSIEPRYGNPMLNDAYQELSGNKVMQEPVQCPFYDDWRVPDNELWRRSYRPFFISIYTAEHEKAVTTINLDDILYEDSKLHEIVRYILKKQGVESFRGDCIFNISSYIRNRMQVHTDMTLDENLLLTIKAKDIHPQRHLVISEISNYRFLNPKWWDLINQFPDFFKPKTKPGGNNIGVDDATHRAFRIFRYNIIPRNTGIREPKS